MRCREFKRLTSLYLDGRLDETEEKALREHLSRCPRCAETLAALESAEKSARTSPTAEPEAKYWDTFSRRVMEKIETRQEAPQGFGLKRLAAVLFPPSSRRLRIAASVASIAIVVAVGVLYVERRGEGVVPPVARAPAGKQEAPGAPEVAGQAVSEATKPLEKGPTTETTTAGEVTAADRAQIKEATEPPKDAEKKERSTTSETIGSAGKGVTPVTAQGAEPQKAATEEGMAEKAAGIRDAERKPTEVAATPKQAEEPTQPKQPQQEEDSRALRTTRETEAPAAQKVARPRAESFTILDQAQRSPIGVLEKAGRDTLRQIAEGDTSITTDELRRTIELWKAHIESHPKDSLALNGYRQVATGYALLAARTQDDTVIAEGVRVVRGYLERTEDPELKAFLITKLREIEALRKK